MKLVVTCLALGVVACRPPSSSTVPGATPAEIVAAPIGAAAPAAAPVAVVAAAPTSCGVLEPSPAPDATCTPTLLAQHERDALTKVWEVPCPVFDLRNDGAVMYGHQGGIYAIVGEPSPGVPMSRQVRSSTVAGAGAYDLVIRGDGTQQLVAGQGSRCEALPIAAPGGITGRADGEVVYWGRAASGARQLVRRSPDGKWQLAPPLPGHGELATELWTQGGHAVASYQVTATSGRPAELGYYDEATRQLRPIRRGGNPLAAQLVPGAAAGEPPTALYLEDGKLVVEQPDVAQGYRRLERALTSMRCPDGGPPVASRTPTGSYRHLANPVLFRTTAGGLWLAYTDTRGRCTYQLETHGARRSRSVSPDERALFARPAPRPPEWRLDQVPEQVELVLVAVERGRFGQPRRLPLPARSLTYAGPWQSHPSVTAARVRIVIGSVVIDLDPNKLASAPPLERPWVAPAPAPVAAVTTIPTPPPANAPPFPALRPGPLAAPLAITAQPERTIVTPHSPGSSVVSTCKLVPRSARDATLVEHQLVLACDHARALAMTADGNRVAFTQFSQRGYEPVVEIAPSGAVTITAQPARAHDSELRYTAGKLELGPRLPAGAPAPPAGWNVYEHDGNSVFATSHDRRYELMRGTLDRTQPNAPRWSWEPAFPGGRTPPTGPMFWPVLLPNAGADPTIVYVRDPRDVVDIFVRTAAGVTIALPTWGRGAPGNYRVHRLAAAHLAGSPLPVVAAKVDDAVVVAYPVRGTYAVRALAGNAQFPELTAPPRGASATPTPGPRGPRCSEAITLRAREELYSPQLFTWRKAVGLAYLSTRVRERLRWTLVPMAGQPGSTAKPTCGWLLDERTTTNELALARLDGQGHATERARIPVEYRGGTGAHGSTLLVDTEGDVLHAIATSNGTTTYTRITLPAR